MAGEVNTGSKYLLDPFRRDLDVYPLDRNRFDDVNYPLSDGDSIVRGGNQQQAYPRSLEQQQQQQQRVQSLSLQRQHQLMETAFSLQYQAEPNAIAQQQQQQQQG